MSNSSWQDQPDPFRKEPREEPIPLDETLRAPGPEPTPYAPYPPTNQPYGQPAGQPYGQPYGAPFQPTPPTNGMAIASLVLSCLGLVSTCAYGLGVIPALIGAILGHVARGQIKSSGESGGGLALAGVIVGWVTVAFVVLIVMVVVGVFVIAGVNYDSY